MNDNSADRTYDQPGGAPWSPRGTGPLRPVPAVARAAGILRVLAGGQEASLTVLARAVGIYKSTAHGILGTLAAFDLVERDPGTRLYRLGPALVALGRAAQDPGDLAALARPHLVHLSRLSGETVTLHVRDGDGSVIVASEESPHRLKVTAPPGFRMPAHAGAVAKVFGAFEARPQPLSEALPPFTSRTITDPARYRHELDAVRRRGVAFDDQEYNLGVRAASIPVFGADRRRVVGAISVVGVAARTSIADLRRLVKPLRAASHSLSEALCRVSALTRGPGVGERTEAAGPGLRPAKGTRRRSS